MNTFIDAVLAIADKTQAHLDLLLGILAVVWAMFLLTIATNYRLLILGIYPRSLFGLIGIIFAPFLHASFNHIFFNSIPLFILSDFILIEGVELYWQVTILLILLSGLLTWAFARDAIHIGASSVITGYWSFLVMNSLQQGGALSIILAIICLYYFAGIFFGIFPSKKGVSWEGHLFGLISGIAINYALPSLPMINSLS